MSEERSGAGIAQRRWLERLGLATAAEPRSRDELIDLLRDAQRRGLLDADALAMMEGVIQVSEVRVRDVMIPRSQMVVVQKDWPVGRILAEVLESGHSRFPVVDEGLDDVVGILLVKDLLRYAAEPNNPFRFHDVLRPAKVIPESKRLNVLLKEFRSTRLHMAMVVDEYGGTAGLVTIEDVLEQIVGEIDDEHDSDEEGDIRRHGEREYIVKALMPVEDFNEYFGSGLSDERADTLSGLIMLELGRLPKRGDTVEVGGYRFKILRADNRRIHLLHLSLRPGQVPPDADLSEPRR